ncbi:MAG: efflux transporter periplasmic adaptor subunit [Betaproteobacteria bacterium RBG_16_56_24]|nr:MAG: efflux transporter periplasmic adaptor subunit [Betaproteobacteria bacterium RBG_16_56_24]
MQNKHNPFFRYLPWLSGLVLLAIAAWYFTRPAPPAVQLAKVDRGVVEATVSNTRAGTVKACRRAKLSAPAGGQISRMLVNKGQRVKANQVLLELWDKDLQAQEQLAQEQLATAQTQAHQACVQADLAEKEGGRARQLKEGGFISAEGLDQKVSAAKVARAGCEAASSQIEQSQSRIIVARAGLQRMVLRAPFDGIIADISGELGEYATPSPPGILTLPAIDLIDDSCMFVSAPIDEVDAANIKVGQEARITLDAIKGKAFPGKVKRIAPYVLELEKQARTVEVEVSFVEPPSDENLLVGYSADVEIVHASRASVLRIPTQTLLEGNHVLLLQDNGVLAERTVTTGLANWEQTEITSGLKEGDQIVLTLDREGVKSGARVQPEVKK